MTTLTNRGEILISLCDKCKCCLANSAHCWVCHTSSTIDAMCGCNECSGRIDAFLQLENVRKRLRR